MLALVLASALAAAAMSPAAALAHGPVAPIALDYRAQVSSAPKGLEAKVVDGDQRMWLRVSPSQTVVVLDYRGAPYLRFTPSGVEVNENSAMFYLNQTPIAVNPPPGLGPKTPPKWQRVSGGHDYEWHDGRLHALATVALRPGASFVGTWRIPVVTDGIASALSGSLWHADAPSIAWFWPIVVLLLCVLAAWRVKEPRLDKWTARLLALGALGAIAAAAIGRGLHGRPTVTVLQLIELGLVMAFVVWALFRVLARRSGFFLYFVIGLVALWQGLEMSPTLVNGFVLIPLPPFLARAAAVVALGAGAGLLVMGFRLFEAQGDPAAEEPGPVDALAEDDAWELA
jgi:hypothetical protein